MGNHRVGTTAKSGYIQRRIIKVCEDISVKYDGSVRDTTGKIYQMAYGDTGFDPCSTVKVGDRQQCCDVSRIVDRLNLQLDIYNEEKNESKQKSEKQVKVTHPTPIFHRRIDLLKALEKATGKKCLYKGISDEELVKNLEKLNLK